MDVQVGQSFILSMSGMHAVMQLGYAVAQLHHNKKTLLFHPSPTNILYG
jgi:hypothetical protein